MKRETEKNKQKVIQALEKHLGIITAAAKEVGVRRETIYLWLRTDEEFKKQFDLVSEYTLDFVENQLLKKIKEGNDKAIMFYMRYKGKSRGYVDNLDITTDGEKVNEIKLIEIKGGNTEH